MFLNSGEQIFRASRSSLGSILRSSSLPSRRPRVRIPQVLIHFERGVYRGWKVANTPAATLVFFRDYVLHTRLALPLRLRFQGFSTAIAHQRVGEIAHQTQQNIAVPRDARLPSLLVLVQHRGNFDLEGTRGVRGTMAGKHDRCQICQVFIPEDFITGHCYFAILPTLAARRRTRFRPACRLLTAPPLGPPLGRAVDRLSVGGASEYKTSLHPRASRIHRRRESHFPHVH